MGFHSYRNIGFSFTDAETTCRKWREKFTGFDCRINRPYISILENGGSVAVRYLDNEYRLLTENGVLEKKENDEWTEKLQMNEALTVYHYLGDEKKPVHQPGNWVPESALDPVRIRTSDRTDPLFVSFAKQYAGKVAELADKCRAAGGTSDPSAGDTAWIFRPFPEIPVRIVFWDADEDFPAQIKAYVRENATDYVHYEAVSFMIADIFLKIDTAGKNQSAADDGKNPGPDQ